MWNNPCSGVQHHKICLPSLFSTKPLLSSSSRHIYPLYGTYFCVYCLYEAVDTMPSPKFRRSFPIGRTIFVLTFQMRSVVPSRNIIQSQQGYENCLPAFKLLLSMAYRTPDFQHSIRKVATKRWRLTISTNVCRLCKLLANCEFALHGIWNSRFSTFDQNSSKKETRTHDCPCELLVNCEFALRGSDSFRSSEPKETNALNACNVKWPVYSTGCC